MSDFFTRHFVWQVYFEDHGALAWITISYRRALSNQMGVKFDEDAEIINTRLLGFAAEDEDRMVMDGVLALIPDGALLSCALWRLQNVLLLWERSAYDHVFAGQDKQVVRAAFDGRLFNTEGSIGDVLFIGGAAEAHTKDSIEHWAQVIERDVMSRFDTERLVAWKSLLDVYQAVMYTLSTEIHMIARNEPETIPRARAALGSVAARYGFVLPPE
ncbi:MAG: hypothetical protein MI924_32280 [Chloroflexales bacterium]|nr:hypothetical protein [Chloroflexales bacterium]